jgi:hypothetical protein
VPKTAIIKLNIAYLSVVQQSTLLAEFTFAHARLPLSIAAEFYEVCFSLAHPHA